MGDDKAYNYTTYQDNYVRTDEMKKELTSFFLRADKFENEVKKTPYTLMDFLQSLGHSSNERVLCYARLSTFFQVLHGRF